MLHVEAAGLSTGTVVKHSSAPYEGVVGQPLPLYQYLDHAGMKMEGDLRLEVLVGQEEIDQWRAEDLNDWLKARGQARTVCYNKVATALGLPYKPLLSRLEVHDLLARRREGDTQPT